LSFERIVTGAERETGHSGIAGADTLERLGRLVEWINRRGPYTADQLERMRRQLQQVLATRLRLAGDRRRIAAIAQERIERPLFVIGFPRTGTTLLHSLLAEDPAVQAPRWWHSHVPSPPPGETAVCGQRLALAARELQRFVDFVPGLLQLHPYWDKGAEALIEDEELFTLDFHNAYPTLLYQVPTLEVMVDIGGSDATAAYRFHREVLQHLQWNNGSRRWALKGVGHQFLLEALFEVYPDALCLWPHREPAEIQASMLSIAAVLYDAINGGRIDWKRHARATLEGVKAGLDRVMASPLIDDPRVVHLRFKELAADPVGTVREVYRRGGMDCTAEFEARMRTWLDDPENRADRYGRYPYSYAPFGLEAGWVRELFAGYSRRFGLV
jgi:hypothetical protein